MDIIVNLTQVAKGLIGGEVSEYVQADFTSGYSTSLRKILGTDQGIVRL